MAELAEREDQEGTYDNLSVSESIIEERSQSMLSMNTPKMQH